MCNMGHFAPSLRKVFHITPTWDILPLFKFRLRGFMFSVGKMQRFLSMIRSASAG